MKKENIENVKNEYETCVLCNCKTNIPVDMPISKREFYIEGAGQLCLSCYYKLYGKNTEASREYC